MLTEGKYASSPKLYLWEFQDVAPVMTAYISLEFWCFVLSIHPNKWALICRLAHTSETAWAFERNLCWLHWPMSEQHSVKLQLRVMLHSVLVRANCVTWFRNGKWVILIPVSTLIGSSFIIKQFQEIMIAKVTSDALQPTTMMEQEAKNSTFMAGYI